MGERLGVRIEVPEPLKTTPLPPMMLQTLVENAIKHGLEPMPGGGTIWILRAKPGSVSLTVADDGRGFSEDGGGTGIGLKNVRERLRLAYGERRRSRSPPISPGAWRRRSSSPRSMSLPRSRNPDKHP